MTRFIMPFLLLLSSTTAAADVYSPGGWPTLHYDAGNRRAVARARGQQGPLLGAALDTLARARFDTGDVAGAIDAQQQAVERMPVQRRADAEATLERYRAARDR